MNWKPFDKYVYLPFGAKVWLIKEGRWDTIEVCLAPCGILGVKSIVGLITKGRCSFEPPNNLKTKLNKLLKDLR